MVLDYRRARGARLLKTDRAVNLALDEATTKAAAAQALTVGDPARWIEAIEAVRRAEAILSQNQGSTEVASRLLVVKTLINGERGKAESVGKDRRMVERLVEIHDDLGVHGDSARAEAEWAAAFRDYGVDLDALDPAVAGARLALSPVAAELAGGLDQWIFVRRGQRPPDRASVEPLLTVAKLADPDPWRNRLRDTLNERVTDRGRTRDALEQLAASADADTLPEASVTRLAFALCSLATRTWRSRCSGKRSVLIPMISGSTATSPSNWRARPARGSHPLLLGRTGCQAEERDGLERPGRCALQDRADRRGCGYLSALTRCGTQQPLGASLPGVHRRSIEAGRTRPKWNSRPPRSTSAPTGSCVSRSPTHS